MSGFHGLLKPPLSLTARRMLWVREKVEGRAMKLTPKYQPSVGSIPVIPILPRSGLYLVPVPDPQGLLGVSETGYQRFATQFKGAFHRLPRSVRLRMIEFWQDPDAGRFAPSPMIMFSGAAGEPGIRTFAAVQCGIRLMFHPVVQRMPNPVLQDLIGHELAHCFQWATGEITPGLDEGKCEMEADWLMENWGFDPYSIDEWAEQDGVHEFAGLGSSGHRYASGVIPLEGWAD